MAKIVFHRITSMWNRKIICVKSWYKKQVPYKFFEHKVWSSFLHTFKYWWKFVQTFVWNSIFSAGEKRGKNCCFTIKLKCEITCFFVYKNDDENSLHHMVLNLMLCIGACKRVFHAKTLWNILVWNGCQRKKNCFPPSNFDVQLDAHMCNNHDTNLAKATSLWNSVVLFVQNHGKKSFNT